MCFCRVSDAGTERYKAPCRNIHVSFVCRESQKGTESLNADWACYLVRRKSSAFLQGHECNPKRPLLDQGFACATSLGRFSKFAQRVILCSEHECQHLCGKPAGPKNTGFFTSCIFVSSATATLPILPFQPVSLAARAGRRVSRSTTLRRTPMRSVKPKATRMANQKRIWAWAVM